MSYRFVDSFRTGPGWPCSKAVYKPVWNIPLLSVQWMNSWWWTKELSETCRVSCQNKFLKLVHLVGFIIKEKYLQGDCKVNMKPYMTVFLKRYTIALPAFCTHFHNPQEVKRKSNTVPLISFPIIHVLCFYR